MGNKKIGGFGIEIKKLYKIFGPNGADCVKLVEQGVTKTELNAKHGHVLGLRDINISMPAGGIQVIMGLSGSGKSTLIRHINRLIDPTSGEVVIGDEDVVKMDAVQLREFRRHQTAMVFQKFALLPHRTVLENTLYGLEIQGHLVTGRSTAPCGGSNVSDSRVSRANIPISCRAVCNSVSVLPVRWRTMRRSC